jgi:DNA polymerase I-like protein with 3'-5' exonuclease and polymerase domains
MFYIVETENSVDELFDSFKEDSSIYLDIIPFHDYYHPKLQSVCCVYLRPLDSHKGYIIPISHSEALKVKLSHVYDRLSTLSKDQIYSINGKFIKYFFRKLEVLDVSYYASINNKGINLEYTATSIKTNFYKKYKKNDANFYIPITKLHEEKEEQFDALLPIIKNIIKEKGLPGYNYFKDVSLTSNELFYIIESNGIKLNRKSFVEHFSNVHNPAYSLFRGRIYTYYNLYNYTGRPSNSFNGINFLALNRDIGERKAFVPSNDILMDLDFSSYHVYLISKIINYDFGGDGDIHTHLGKLYFKKEALTKQEYDKAKNITFSNIYGGIRKEYSKIPFFIALDAYIKKIFSELQEKGEYLFDISGRVYKLEHINSINSTKFFNYLLQGLETYVNLSVINKFFSLLNGKKSKIILYLYDSFLFDLDINEKEDIIESINQFLTNKIAYKLKYGSNYNDLW